MRKLPLLRHIRYLLEAAVAFLLLALCRLLPLDAASALGGFLARSIGPWTQADRTAAANLARIFPETDAATRAAWKRGMWDNLGRTTAELVHINRPIMRERIQIEGMEILEGIRGLPEQPVIFFAAHLANWELAPKTAYLHGLPIELIYRPANNPYIEWLITSLRRGSYDRLYHKGPQGAMKLSRSLKAGGKVGMLIDQKMNNGIPVDFMGHPAMTAPAIIEFAARYGAWLVPGQVVRKRGAHFTVIIHPAILFDKQTTSADTVRYRMEELHRLMEGWIRQHPDQWFWVHNRWIKP